MQSARVEPHTRTGRQHVEVGREDARRHLEAHLVVALAGAAVPDRVGAVPAGRRDEVLDDHRPRERRDQRVLALVQRVGPQRGHEEVARELLARVDDLDLDRAGRRGALADHRPLRPARAGRRRPRTRSTSTPHSSRIHRTAIEVSSPPEYASTTRFATMQLPLIRARRGRRARRRRPRRRRIRCTRRARVSSPAIVPSTGPSDARSSAERDDVRAPGRRAQHDEVARCAPPRRRIRPAAA